MVEYPWVIDAEDRKFLLYNGNAYGATGIGLAVWEPPGGNIRVDDPVQSAAPDRT
jgi:hypothetical protein